MRNILCTSFAAAMLAATAAPAAAHGTVVHSAVTKQEVSSSKAVQTAAALRDLWVDHVFWVRNVVVAVLARNDAASKIAEQQVVANAQSIAAAIEPFYGAAAKEGLFKLLAGHYGAIKSYLTATEANDAAGQSRATQALTANAEEIATFLSKANPNLPKNALNGMLLAHGGHHIQQIQELKAGKYEAEARTWHDMKSHMHDIADALAQALVKQFATRF